MKIKNLIIPVLFSILCFNSAFVNPPSIEPAIELGGDADFYEFLSQFEKVELPYQIGIEQMTQYNVFRDKHATTQEKSSIPQAKSVIKRSRYIPETKASFSRMGPPIVEPVARFYPNDKMIAVIYKTSNRYSSSLYKSYHMMLFDLKGNRLMEKEEKKKLKGKTLVTSSNNNIGYSSPQETVAFNIDKTGRIVKTTYKNIWKKDLGKVAFQENLLLGFEKQDALVYQINPQGNLVEVKTSVDGSRASLK